MLAKIKRYSILSLIAILLGIIGYQAVRNWVTGIEHSQVGSGYRRKPTRMPAKPLDPPKGSQPMAKEIQGFLPPLSEDNPQPQFTIGRWELVDIPCNRDVTISVTADEQGQPAMSYEVEGDGAIEIGYDTLFYGYYAREWQVDKEFSMGQEVGIGIDHDLFRLGPLWVRGNAELGYEKVRLSNGAELNGVKVVTKAKIGVKW